MNWGIGTAYYLVRAVAANDMDNTLYHDQDEGEHPPPADVTPTKPEQEFNAKLLIQKTKPEPCDTEFWIYNYTNTGYNKTMSDDCSRPYIIQPVVASNLVLLVINNVCKDDQTPLMASTNPTEVNYNMSLGCYKVHKNSFPRRQYMSCINRSIHVRIISYTIALGILRFLP